MHAEQIARTIELKDHRWVKGSPYNWSALKTKSLTGPLGTLPCLQLAFFSPALNSTHPSILPALPRSPWLLPAQGYLFLLLFIICSWVGPRPCQLLSASISLWKDPLLLLHHAQAGPFPYLCAVQSLADTAILKKDPLTKWQKEKLTVTSGLDFQRVHRGLGCRWNFFSSEACLIGSCAIHGRILLGKARFWIPTLFLFFWLTPILS